MKRAVSALTVSGNIFSSEDRIFNSSIKVFSSLFLFSEIGGSKSHVFLKYSCEIILVAVAA